MVSVILYIFCIFYLTTGTTESALNELLGSIVLTLFFIVPIVCTYGLPEKQEVQQYKLLYVALYLLIWGEVANLRLMPECLCYIFHYVCKIFYTVVVLSMYY
jgi:hypothetical protein